MYQAPRGTQDILPEDMPYWSFVEDTARRFAMQYGYREIRTPMFEDTGLFYHGAGEATDVVEKEMYSFKDKGGVDITLRAEGTAPIVRAYLEHGLHSLPQPIRLFSLISVFRYDRPQKGRLREHHQFDAEAFGEDDPALDAEVITMLWRFYEAIGLKDLTLQLNSIGCPVCRPEYIKALREYYTAHLTDPTTGEPALCGDCQRRLEKNPLRLLDCKVPTCQPIAAKAPSFVDHLCQACTDHFAAVKDSLQTESIPTVLNHRLVRGFDYYTRTVFEVWPPRIGAQSSIGGGGRYDGLAEAIGGRHTPGVGFGTGIERLILNLRDQGVTLPDTTRPEVYVASLSDGGRAAAADFARELREHDVRVIAGVGSRSIRARLRNADATGARWAALFGDDEVRDGTVALRDLTAATPETLPVGAAVERVVKAQSEKAL